MTEGTRTKDEPAIALWSTSEDYKLRNGNMGEHDEQFRKNASGKNPSQKLPREAHYNHNQ